MMQPKKTVKKHKAIVWFELWRSADNIILIAPPHLEEKTWTQNDANKTNQPVDVTMSFV